MAIEIIGTGRAVPSKRVSNDDLAATLDTSDEWIRSHTGIGNRHVSDENTASSDVATEAVKNALAMVAGYTGDDAAEIDKAAAEVAETIDMIVLATATADFYGCPSTACIVQHNIGAKNAAAMDITAGCTGFVYALETAAGLLSVNAQRKRALVIGVDLLTKVANWSDRGTCVLFGDGAGVVVLEKTIDKSDGCCKGKTGLLQSFLFADGSGKQSLVMSRGGSRNPFKTGEVIDTASFDHSITLAMNGKEVYNFAVKALTDTIEALLKAENITIDDVTKIVPHQANARIVQAAARRLRIPDEKFYMNIEEYANTSSATIPMALDEMNRSGQLQKGDLILTIGFGGGLTYGGNIIVW